MGTVSGAIKGGAEGAIVGDGAGAVPGAILGGAEGHHKKVTSQSSASWGVSGPSGSGHGGQKLLVAEFFIVIVILALGALGGGSTSSTGSSSSTSSGGGQFMKQASAAFAVFLILSLFGAIGPTCAKYAAGIGGLMTLAMAFNQYSAFSNVATMIQNATGSSATGTPAPNPTSNLFNSTVTPPGNGTTASGTQTSTNTDSNGDITGFNPGIGGVQAGTGGIGAAD
jgi:hypothetical protein